MAEARDYKVELKGKYAWELLEDIYHDRSAGYFKNVDIDRTVTYSFSDLQKSVISSIPGFNWAALVDVFHVRVTGGTKLNLQSEYLYLSNNKLELVDHKQVTKKFVVCGHGSFNQLYRLMFFGPGLNVLTDCSYWENLEVVYTDNVPSRPQRSLFEVRGSNPDINAGFGGKHVWLVPTWTDDPEKALTGIEFVMQDYENPNLSDLAMGAGGAHRYLIMKRDPASKQRITEVSLFRTKKENKYPESYGWDYRTQDLNLDRQGDYLYLCWKSLQL